MGDHAWPSRPLGGLCLLISRGRQPAYVDDSPVLAISQKCVRSRGFDPAGARGQDPQLLDGHLVALPGDVLLNSTGTGTLGRVCVFDASGHQYVVDGHVTVFRPNPDRLDSIWLRENLAHPNAQEQIDLRFVTGSTNQIELQTSRLAGFVIPWPPIATQRAVADILDAVDAAIRETEALIIKLATVRAGLIDDLLTRGLNEHGELRDQAILVETEVGRRPKTWKVGPLGQFLAGAEYGTSTGLDLGPGIPVLRMNNIQDGEFDLSDLRYSKLPAVEALRLRFDDVLYNRTNSWEHVGKAVIWREANDGPAFASYLVRLVCSDKIAPKYLHLWMNWLLTQRALRRFATPGVQQVNVNPTNLQRLEIGIPTDTAEQVLIAERVDALRERRAEMKEWASKMRALRDGLRDDLLSGRVQVAVAAATAE